VTGFVPVIGHPRTVAEYGALGEKLMELPQGTVHPFYQKVEDCWLSKYISGKGISPTWSVGDNGKKNSLKYQIATHQKFAWLSMALAHDPTPDTFVWIDYGIHHVPGVTTEVIKDLLDRIKPKDFAIPGCWAKDDPRCSSVGDMWPNWRFCGGVMVVPREQVVPLFAAVKRAVRSHLDFTNNITWDVNNLARVETGGVLPIRWYQADHNETMFTAY
jgi:hypothetical protein